jgi:hypothetical protein
MANDGAFLVEDFLGAIASQLDRTQDALASKAVNRPLTYAIKDFTMELKVFVDMDPQGRVRFRSPGANEPGASAVHIGFTTITRAMIQENTVDVTMSRAPTLREAGLPEADRRRLERLGVRTTAELKNLGGTAGADGLSRLAGVPVDRLRAALTFGRPRVSAVRPLPPAPPRPATPPPPPPRPATPPPRPPVVTAPPRPPVTPAPRAPVVPPRPAPRAPIMLPPATRRLELVGRNLLADGGEPEVRLDGRPLAVADADEGRLVVELPEDGATTGTLEVDHGDGDVTTYELASGDPWAPEGA